MRWQQHLKAGLQALHHEHEALFTPLATYLTLLEKWNKVYNLTAVRSLEDMVSKHILDSLAVAPFIKGNVILDVGSGAGLPGIPLAILFPHKNFILLESIGKKACFLEMVKGHLALSRLHVIHSRAEAYQPLLPVDCVISRAVASVSQLIQWTHAYVRPGGRWVLMKGQIPTEELIEVRQRYHVHSYQVPGLAAARCVVCVERD